MIGETLKEEVLHSKPLSSDEVQERMNFMVDSINDSCWQQVIQLQKEEDDEVEVIKLKTKTKLLKIDASYKALEERIKTETKTQATKRQIEGRLELLGEKDKHLTEIIMSVYHRLGRIDHNEHRKAYRRILYALVVQSLVRLLEREVVVVMREVDVPQGAKILNMAQEKYAELTGLEVSIFN